MKYKILSEKDKEIVIGNIKNKDYDSIQSYECACDCNCFCDCACACFCFDSLDGNRKNSLDKSLFDFSIINQ